MEALFEQLLAWVGENPGWAYAIVFMVAMTESTAVLGVIVPGVILLMGTGALITTGAIAFWPAFAAAVAGAIAGDGLSYAIGRHYNEQLRTIWPFSRHPEYLDHGVAFFERYGGWSVAIGRFAGPSRAIIPLVAGMLQMSPQRFYVANIASGIAQTFAFFIPGMVFGASIKLAAEAAVRLVILGLALTTALWLTIWTAHRLYRLSAPHTSQWLQGLLRWADLHPNMGRIAHALADPDHPDTSALTGLAFLLLLATLLVGAITGLALFGSQELALNLAALELGQSLHTPLGDRLMVSLSALGSPTVVLSMVLILYIWLRWRGLDSQANYWLAAAAFPLIATPLLGALLAMPRPELGLQLLLPWSFPSGAVLLATTVYGFLAVTIARGVAERWRWVPYALASAAVASVAWARVYLGAEWLTSVVDSIALGLGWVAALGLAFHRHSRVGPSARALGGVALIGLALGLALQGWLTDDRNLAHLTPQVRTETISSTDWHASAWTRLPNRREDLSQRNQHPLTIQYAGDPGLMARALAGLGWTPAEEITWSNAMRLLSPSLPLAELPMIPQVHDGRHEALILTKTLDDDQREVLRIWPTRWRLDDGKPLWVGNVTRQHKGVLLDLIVFPATDPQDFALPEEFIGTLPDLSIHPTPDGGVVLIEADH
jgi:membrane protein DedA with SNARE-associated domain